MAFAITLGTHPAMKLITIVRIATLLALSTSFTSFAVGADDEATSLPQSIQRILTRFKLSGEGLSLLVIDADSGREILSYRANTPRNPASAIKLVTSYAALDLLTPAYQWATEVHTDGNLENGRLNGDLWLKGGGDPYLPLERMWLLVHRLRTEGLSTIDGDLVIDQSLFEPIIEDPNAFDGQGLRAYNVVPAALVSNFNVSTFLFRPGQGTRVDVQLVPALPGLQIVNNLRAVDRPCRGYNRGIAMNLDDQGRVILDGKFPRRCKIYSMARSVMPRDQYTAQLFKLLWQQSGGQWNGRLRKDQRDFDQKPMLSFESVHLGQAVRSINKYSNNLMTRMLFLTLGLEQYGAPANTEKSRRALMQWLAEQQIDTQGMFIDNGAGSSRKTRASAQQLAQLLYRAWHSPYMPELMASMAITGQDGTFSRRHAFGPLHGRAHLKTGRLDHVVAMAGKLQAKDNARYLVVSLHNAKDAHRGSGHAVQDALLTWVYNYEHQQQR